MTDISQVPNVPTNPVVPASVVVPVVAVAKTKEEIAAEKAAAEAAQVKRFAEIKEAFAVKGAKVDVVPQKFFFKKVEEVDANDKPTGVTTKRPTVNLPLVRPSFEGIVEILENRAVARKNADGTDSGVFEDSKEYRLLLESIEETVASHARDLLNENEKYDSENFPLEHCLWSHIANLPPGERRGTGISKETWEEMIKDYIAVMPAVTGGDVDRIKKSAYIFATKYATVKTVKAVLRRCKELLALYADTTTRGEEFADCIAFLLKKADIWLATSDQTLADAL